ncbi:MAG: cytochrome-c oxidase, cbb3-type subunit II [Zetaproteobacteria bacterium CG2_30_46_52]|nr:MAG: cytochrome-c oxidase, cbb3-type subunit II [Zetaproteobacteria bacterium CG2_30_46_52]
MIRGIPHDTIESSLPILATFVAILVAVGGIVEIVPTYYLDDAEPAVEGVRPYTPLELEGYAIYRREGCFLCHSQMIRPLRDEKERYGHFSLAAESQFDHNYQWGSKRTGPELARLGGKYTDQWHIQHMRQPKSVVPESVMPNYFWLEETPLDTSKTKARMEVLAMMNVPYSADDIANWEADLKAQAAVDDGAGEDALRARYERKTWENDGVVTTWTDSFTPTPINVRAFDTDASDVTELDALIAYLQQLGTSVHFEEGVDYYHDKFGKPYRK